MKKIDLQLFGVYPVHNNVFEVSINGRDASPSFAAIKDMETFSPAVDGNTEEWTPMDQGGWIRRAVTGKGLSLAISGKRNYGDAGNDYIASLLLLTGQDVESIFRWTLPNGDVLTMNCVINLTTPAGGDSTNIDSLEFDILSDGLPAYAANGAIGELTFVCVDGTGAGATKISAVSPILGGSNSYFIKINGDLPNLDTDISDLGWTAYTLGDDIPTTLGNDIALVEAVSATTLAKLGGVSPAVIV